MPSPRGGPTSIRSSELVLLAIAPYVLAILIEVLTLSFSLR